MRIIIIESSVYRCSEKVFKEIQAKQIELSDYTEDFEMSLYLDSMKPKMTYLDDVSFDFRL